MAFFALWNPVESVNALFIPRSDLESIIAMEKQGWAARVFCPCYGKTEPGGVGLSPCYGKTEPGSVGLSPLLWKNRAKVALLLPLLVLLPLLAQADNRFLAGRFQPEKHPNFRVVPAKYSPGRTQYLDARALAAFEEMAESAAKAGFRLTVISATRNFFSQKAIWEEKFTGVRKIRGQNIAKTIPNEEQRSLEILRYSSMPGTSRHHWGTDLDLHEAQLKGPALSNDTLSKGRGLELYNWLVENAGKHGFCQPYRGAPTARNGGRYVRGYEEERWHWSYKPLSSPYLRQYNENAKALAPTGFLGDKAAGKFYLDYVNNIDSSCL